MAKNLMSAYTFASLKNVSNTIIYRLIKSGDIDTEVIGKHKYIDYNKYSHLTFKTGNRQRK